MIRCVTPPRIDLSRFDAAIVDLDGTMVDTLGDFVVALNLMLRDLSLAPVEAAAVETMVNGQHSEVYEGVATGLAALRERGLRLACLTNKPTAFALPLLAAKGLDGYFEQVFGGDAFERKKPDPLPLRKTCEALGTLPARTLMVGDSSNDAKAARAAGCPVVLVSYGYNHGEPVRNDEADNIVDSLLELSAQDLPSSASFNL